MSASAELFGVSVKSSSYDDWFLPSRDELKEMHTNLYLHGVGDFIGTAYKSSTDYNTANNISINFPTAGVWPTSKNDVTYPIRPCRSFTATVGAYALRDIGPAGGLIFYISGTTYYEASPSDLTSLWSNIQDEYVTTGTAIGTGQANTIAIINQAGHTDSAAKLCDDLIE